LWLSENTSVNLVNYIGIADRISSVSIQGSVDWRNNASLSQNGDYTITYQGSNTVLDFVSSGIKHEITIAAAPNLVGIVNNIADVLELRMT